MISVTPEEFYTKKGGIMPSAGLVYPSKTAVKTTEKTSSVKESAKNTLRWIGKQIMKPVSTLAVTGEQIGKGISGEKDAFAALPKTVADVWSGKLERSFSNIVQEAMPEHPVAGTVIGTVADILFDPLNFVGGGLTKTGKVAKTVTNLQKAGRTIEAGSKIAKTVEKLPEAQKTAEALKLGATKAEQALKGQRTPLSFAGKSLVSKEGAAKFYETTGKAKEVIGATKPAQVLKQFFSTKTNNAEFNLVLDHFRSLGNYRAAATIEKAQNLAKNINKIPDIQFEQILNYVEKVPGEYSDDVKKVGDEISTVFKEWKQQEQALGVLGEGIEEGYLTHIKKPDDLSTAMKNMFKSSKEWSSKLSNAEGRSIGKFVAPDGEVLIGVPEHLKLSPMEIPEGIARAEKATKNPKSKYFGWDMGGRVKYTTGDIQAINKALKIAEKRGYKTKFRASPVSKPGASGHFSPGSQVATVGAINRARDVLATFVHEIGGHAAHFKAGGIAELYKGYNYKDFASAGKKVSAALENLKNVSGGSEEYKRILEITRKLQEGQYDIWWTNKSTIPEHGYYESPAETIANIAGAISSRPEDVKRLAPNIYKAYQEMVKVEPLFGIANITVDPTLTGKASQAYVGKGGKVYQRTIAPITEIEQTFGREMFEKNPAQIYAQRGLAHEKSVTAKEFLEATKDFAVEGGVPVTAPELKGLTFEPEVARAIDRYYEAIKPEEVKKLLGVFDAVQNLWKGQALLAPAYHTRNFVSNLWNNFLAGVSNPVDYVLANNVQTGKFPVRFRDAAGKVWDRDTILRAAKESGVIDEGWYAADIADNVGSTIQTTWGQKLNPLSQNNAVFAMNKKVGSAIENNARLAHFISKLKAGEPVAQAALSVKKHLFDYKDITKFEQTVMKRALPFYTWTRKNLPVQLEHLVYQPQKFAGLEKAVRAIEDISMGDTSPANEKYLSEYIRDNSAMRVGFNKKEGIYYYFLLGAWIPSYQAFDLLSKPFANLMEMATPAVKIPWEIASNKSSIFKNTLGEKALIENYPGDSANYLGINMPKKTANLLRNIRILNELDKLNPGSIFGGKKGQASIFKKAGMPAVDIPGIGTISPATYKYAGTTPAPGAAARAVRFAAGKVEAYKPSDAKGYYDKDTQDRIDNFKYAIKKAGQKGDKERVKVLNTQLKEFIKSRK